MSSTKRKPGDFQKQRAKHLLQQKTFDQIKVLRAMTPESKPIWMTLWNESKEKFTRVLVSKRENYQGLHYVFLIGKRLFVGQDWLDGGHHFFPSTGRIGVHSVETLGHVE